MKGTHPFIFAKGRVPFVTRALEYEGVRPLHCHSCATVTLTISPLKSLAPAL
jgi:hypothetical protein